MTDSTEEINQELDDVLLDDLVEVQERTPGTEEPNLTPGEAVYDERRDDIIEAEISRISSELELSESTQRAAMSLFDQYAGQDDLMGNALEVLAAACLYTACKVESVPLSPDDFASVPETAFTRVILLRRVKSIASTLGLNPQAFFDPSHYVDHYCEDLGLDGEIAERAREILTKADEAGIGSGKSPTGRAAAAVYLAGIESGRKVTQADIADTADVSEVTVRNRYKDQAEILNSSSSEKEEKLSEKSAVSEKNPVADQADLSKTDVATLLRYVAINVERAPKVMDINYYTEYNLDDVIEHFDSLSEARQAAGVSKDTIAKEPLWEQESPKIEISEDDFVKEDEPTVDVSHPYSEKTVRNPSRQTLLDEIERLTNDDSRPNRKDIESASPFSISDYTTTFGGWRNALEEVGYDVSKGRSETITRSDIINCLQEVSQQTDSQPRVTDVNNYGSVSAQSVYKYYDNWNDALEAANVADGPPD